MPVYNFECFKPFDKVLVREGNACQWIPQFFARTAFTDRYREFVVCIGDTYKPARYTQIMPYNNETKDYAFSCDKAPDKYVFWGDDY